MLVGVMSGGSGGMWLLLMRPIITAVTQNLFCVVFFVLLGLGGLLTAHIHIGSSTLLRTNVKKRNETNRQYGHPQLGPWALLCLWGVYIHTEKKEQGGLSSDQK